MYIYNVKNIYINIHIYNTQAYCSNGSWRINTLNWWWACSRRGVCSNLHIEFPFVCMYIHTYIRLLEIYKTNKRKQFHKIATVCKRNILFDLQFITPLGLQKYSSMYVRMTKGNELILKVAITFGQDKNIKSNSCNS